MIGLESKTLKSRRLTYRLLCADDAEALANILSDEAVTEPAGFWPADTEEEFQDFFEKLTEYGAAAAILLDEELIGYINVRRYNPDVPEMRGKTCAACGLVIGTNYQNNGYGTEALGKMTDNLLESFDVCFAEFFVENAAWQKVAAKCGYTYLNSYSVYVEGLGQERTCDSYYKTKG